MERHEINENRLLLFYCYGRKVKTPGIDTRVLFDLSRLSEKKKRGTRKIFFFFSNGEFYGPAPAYTLYKSLACRLNAVRQFVAYWIPKGIGIYYRMEVHVRRCFKRVRNISKRNMGISLSRLNIYVYVWFLFFFIRIPAVHTYKKCVRRHDCIVAPPPSSTIIPCR